MNIFRYDDEGRLAEGSVQMDATALLEQLGVVKSPNNDGPTVS
jgi:hypothetical protein